MQDTLQFYAFSAHKNAGSGVGDIVEDPTLYENLNKIVNWRRMFSSLWSEDPFMYNGLTYLSYEHAYQACKYSVNGYPENLYQFCLESGSDMSKTMKINKKLHLLTPSEIENWENQLDAIKNELYSAKYTLNTRPGIALMNTLDAILINKGPRIRTIRCTRLEETRNKLLNK